MQQHLGPAALSNLSQKEENKILFEIERLFEGSGSKSRRDDDHAVSVAPERARRRFSFVLFAALAVVVALVPAGLRNGDLLGKVAHLTTSN